MHKKNRFRDLLLYMFGFLLLLEWLYPVPHLTYSHGVTTFVVGTILFFVITFLRLPLVVSLLLRGTVVLACLFWLFPSASNQDSWFTFFIDDVLYNTFLLSSGDVVGLTDMYRTMLFFLLLSILSYLLYYWIVHARRILVFLLMSIIYISTIDTFSEYDGSWSIIRYLRLAYFYLLRCILEKEKETGQKAVYSFGALSRIGAFIGVFIMVAASISYAMPKPEPQWPDPLPYIQSAFGFASGGAGSPVQRIGYSDDDRVLGGGFINDDTPVFIATVQEGHYWKGETKDVYTGSGWELSDLDNRSERSISPAESINTERLDQFVEVEEQEANVQFYSEGEQQFNHLFYPEVLISEEVYIAHEQQSKPIQIDPLSSLVTMVDESIPPNDYTLTFQDQTFMVEGLQSIGLPNYSEANFADVQPYLQLPDSLPGRVQELAQELTDADESQYEKAQTIERFLSGPTFEYETEDVPVPAVNEDYVDQFLFETLRGYCDNFSTAMVVMLRSLDIPARWVKGFTEGELQGQSQERDDYNEYIVTNNNAHSWVEVYFPEAGWVPFEPTPSFSGFTFQQPEIETDDTSADDVLEMEDTEEFIEESPEEPEADEEAAVSGEGGADQDQGTAGFATLIVILSMTGFFLVAFLFRRPIARGYLLHKQNATNDTDEKYARSYEQLLWVLHLHGFKRSQTQTLKEYARYVDLELNGTDMVQLTETYESFIYSDSNPTFDRKRFNENWKNILTEIKS
ncbi:LOW QUALITY PROTEIN: transglutaminase-like enzyme [Bacillus sp. JCM 19045]|nr:LOW QUALITY PROTEIN: transglutaminase-like enzyme [Bacillus sp. JCM 19045]